MWSSCLSLRWFKQAKSAEFVESDLAVYTTDCLLNSDSCPYSYRLWKLTNDPLHSIVFNYAWWKIHIIHTDYQLYVVKRESYALRKSKRVKPCTTILRVMNKKAWKKTFDFTKTSYNHRKYPISSRNELHQWHSFHLPSPCFCFHQNSRASPSDGWLKELSVEKYHWNPSHCLLFQLLLEKRMLR